MEKLKESFTKGLARVNIKTSNFMEKTKIKTYIKTLEKENNNTYLEMGKSLYEKFNEGNFDINDFAQDLEKIKSNKKVILEQEEKINTLNSEEERILGKIERNFNNQSEEQEEKFCSNCGHKNNTENKFCVKCGIGLE